MQITPHFSRACLAIFLEQLFQLAEQICLGTEMADRPAAVFLGFGDGLFHFLAVETMVAIAFDEGGLDPLTPENVGEGVFNRGCSGAGRAGDGDDRVFNGHQITQ